MGEKERAPEFRNAEPSWKSEIRANFENGLRFYRAGNAAYLPELARVTAQSGGKERALHLKKLADVAAASADDDGERDFLESVSAQLELALSAQPERGDERIVTMRHERARETPGYALITVSGSAPSRTHISKWKTVVDEYREFSVSFDVSAGQSVTRRVSPGFELTVSLDERGIVTVSSDDFEDRAGSYGRDGDGDSRMADSMASRPVRRKLRVGDRSYAVISAETEFTRRDARRGPGAPRGR